MMLFNFLIRISGNPPRADNANEQIDPGIRMGDYAVMLSAAKHLDALRDRPFAAAQGDKGLCWRKR
jgi:hypothetical protein